jgi:hypothetical protein
MKPNPLKAMTPLVAGGRGAASEVAQEANTTRAANRKRPGDEPNAQRKRTCESNMIFSPVCSGVGATNHPQSFDARPRRAENHMDRIVEEPRRANPVSTLTS